MRSIEVGAGVVTITDETIQLDLGLFGGIKRFHEQSKYIIPILIIATISTVHEAVFGSSPLREFSQFAIILGILTFTFYTLDRLLPRIWNNIGLATELRRTDVKQVEYTAGGRLLPRRLRIIVDDGKTTGVRLVSLSYRQLGEQQLADAKQAFEDAGITIVPAPEEN
ncbi:hypothetical protein [Halocatena marina]|uniref:hypothetical protein n=1 Tax=Halocatena marina TaxID=2934937 RepID=UPI00200FA624|nr:hypothetical protein [Halocatena marina]